MWFGIIFANPVTDKVLLRSWCDIAGWLCLRMKRRGSMKCRCLNQQMKFNDDNNKKNYRYFLASGKGGK